jgi:hypothetical protein
VANTYDLAITAHIRVSVEADSAEDAEKQVTNAFAVVPPALYIGTEDVIYDFSILGINELTR